MKKEGTKKEGKFERESRIVNEILAKEEITFADRIQLLAIYQTPFHETGKIAGLQSCDSSAHGCSFCEKMIAAAEKGRKDGKRIICGSCYDIKQENYRTGVKNRHGLNLLIMSSVLFTEEELATLAIYTPFARFNSSGDIENVIHARNYLRIAKSHKNTHFTFWFKNLAAVNKAVQLEGKPENVLFIYSDPIINGSVKPEVFFKAFAWIDYIFVVAEKELVNSFLEAGYNECNGKKCMECGYACYAGSWKKHTCIVEKLR